MQGKPAPLVATVCTSGPKLLRALHKLEPKLINHQTANHYLFKHFATSNVIDTVDKEQIKATKAKTKLTKALDEAEIRLGITKVRFDSFTHPLIYIHIQPDEWLSVALADLQALKIKWPSTVSRAGLIALLRERYPAHDWEPMSLSRGRYIQQKRLENTIRSIFSVRHSLA